MRKRVQKLKKIRNAYSQGINTRHKVQNLFSIFGFGDTSLRAEPRSGPLSDLLENWWNTIHVKGLEN